MSRFTEKLGRLKLAAERPRAGEVATLTSPVGAASRPTLEALRERIAQVIGRASPPPRRADPTAGELPFALSETERGPLYVRRFETQAGARIGAVPLGLAHRADPVMLSLLALDPTLAPAAPRGALYIDTETTGLSGGAGTVPFLIGVAYEGAGGRPIVEQLLLRQLGQEAPMLARLAELLSRATMIVTYNGKTFDVPLLRTRFVMNRMPVPELPPHLDLLQLARRLHRSRLKVRTLAAIEENVLGQSRVDDVAGADVVACYAHFLRTGDAEALLGVVEHNERDVLSMIALVALYGEPLGGARGATGGGLSPEDLADAARTLRRAGAIGEALELAEAAVERGGGAVARRARGDIAKARGDKARALSDYEAIAAECPDPSVRLELAKLYEHHFRRPELALEQVEHGTGERPEAEQSRRRRLARKIARAERATGARVDTEEPERT